MNSGPEKVLYADGEGEVIVNRHWGIKRLDGGVTWDPGYGSGVYVPLDRSEAEALVRTIKGGVLVTRTETTLVVTTKWAKPTDA